MWLLSILLPGLLLTANACSPTSIFDFSLTDDEMAQIAALNRNEKHDWY